MSDVIADTKPFSWRFVSPLYMGSTLNPINSSLIATALVPIAADLRVSVAQTTMLVTVLYLASAIAQPTAGKLASEFGPRKIFLIGIVMVLLGGLVGGFGQDLTMLVLARILIGLGTSTAYPSAMLLIRLRAESAGMSKPPGSVLGALQIAGVVTAAVGLPIGGVLVEAWGWRTTFWVNIPFAVAAFAMAARWIPRDAAMRDSRTFSEVSSRIDLPGIIGFAAALATLLIFLFSLPVPNWVFLGLSVVLGAVFVWWELRAKHPFIDLRLLAANLALTRTYLRFAALTLCIYTVLYGVTEWIGTARGASSMETGLLLLPMSGLSALVAGPISKRNLVRGPLIVSALSSIAASIGILLLTTATPIIWILITTLIFGITMGTMVSGNQTALYLQASTDQIGTASGLFRTFGYVGSIASSAIIGIIFHKRVSDTGMHHIATIMIVMSAFALLLTIADRQLNPHKKETSAAS
ncbi:MFS transporter [Alicyclobacillus cycloheptanicus]|uniref:MFS family permease n=1 Tax=Alicyclobacillus cycloheptanicus TaxID=1457 RepID=A0ABT9XJV7_9BACL|nr:MFS transporter [Alicyclobacillus cycloheptanicus]MDQ0190006.1 MFS family permease [Alicyclobacillus cycloheptanicus]WDM00087.1 MFS transporter [Alicyclobacillus cycloheptanicus]